MAKQSLFSQQKPAATETPQSLVMPDMPGGGLTAIVPPEERGPASTWVWFAGRRSAKWAEFAAKFQGLAAGEAILMHPDGEIRLGTSVSYFLLDGFQYFATLKGEEDNYAILKAWADAPDPAPKGARVSEYLSLLVLVVHEGKGYPATMRVSDAMARGPHLSIKTATVEALSPEWGTRSAEHATTLAIPDPRFRFKSLLTWRPKKSSTGNTYQISKVSILPTTAGDVAIVKGLGEEGSAAMEEAKEAFDAWKIEVQSKM